MAIYITGDTHGDFQRFGSKYFPQQKEMSWEDYVVIAGDFGGLWDGSQKDQYWLDWLNKKPFTTLFVDGNHENFDLLNTLPEKEWNGGRVHVVREHVLHLMRGQVFDFGGLAWFTMGGAASHDIQDGILDPAAPDFERQYWLMRRMRSMFRVKGVSWWEEEMPSLEEYQEALANLERVNWTVDCVLTHCAPSGVVQEHVLHLMRGQVFNFGGLTWFTMGGAASHDIQDGILDPADPDFEHRYWLMRRMRSMFRVKGVSWWAEEMPSQAEYQEALANLERVNWTVDCVLTHCAPSGVVQKINPSYGTDELTDFLEMVSQRCKFAYWFFGHYHENRIIDQKYILQWEKISELGF